MRKMLGILLAGVVMTAVSGCTLPAIPFINPATAQPTTVGEVPTTQPTSEATGVGQPTHEPQPTVEGETPIAVTDEPVPTIAPELGGGGAGSAHPGEVLYVRQGQVWAIGLDGGQERPLTPTGFDSDIRDMSLSPSGRYLAFTVDGTEVDLLDLDTGLFNIVDTIQLGHIGPVNWAIDGDELFYHKLAFDPVTSAPVTSSISWVDAISEDLLPTLVVESGLAEGPVVHPGFPFGDVLLVQEIFPGQGDLGDWYFYPIASGASDILAFAPGYSIWDVSFDTQRVLMFNRADFQAGGAAPIYIAGLSATEGAVGTIQLSPSDESVEYSKAEFDASAYGILALSRDMADPAAPGPYQLAYLLPSAAGPYVTTFIPLPEGQQQVAFSFVNDTTAVVQSVAAVDPNNPDEIPADQLWVVDLTTGSAIPLTQGQFPIVLPAASE